MFSVMRSMRAAVPARSELTLILGASAFAPAMIVVNNPESPGITSAALVAVGIALLALTVRAVFVVGGAASAGATNAVATSLFVLANTGFVAESVAMGRWFIVTFTGLASWVIYRFRDLKIVDMAISAGTLILILTPVVTWVSNLDIAVADALTAGIEHVQFDAQPDVVVIVADGYASPSVLDEFYSYDNHDFIEHLHSLGFQVVQAMTSNYGRTALSIPSFLQLDYVLEDSVVGPSARRRMLAVLSGENNLVDIMRSNGYHTVYVESGWLGTKCAASNDVCVHGPWPDEAVYDIVHRSAFRGLPGFEAGMSFARGSIHSMTWLDDELDSYLGNEQPDFIYVHVLAPHPPMFLDSACRLEADEGVAGFAVGMPGLSESELGIRRDAYVEQVICVNEHLGRAAREAAASGAIALILADHGPDLGRQMYSDGDAWNAAQRRERFGILLAVHHDGCDYGDLVSLVNVSRRMVACLSNAEFPSLPDRFFDLSRSEGESVVVELADAGS